MKAVELTLARSMKQLEEAVERISKEITNLDETLKVKREEVATLKESLKQHEEALKQVVGGVAKVGKVKKQKSQ